MKKRQIILELTPLLDVILILLFAVLIQSHQKVAASGDLVRETKSAQSLVEKELNDTKKELARVKNRQISLGVIQENSLIITMTVDAASVHRIQLDIEGDTVYINLTEEKDISQKIAETLKQTILAVDKESVFLVFQYDRNKIYHQEYEAVTQAVEELKPALSEEDIYLNYIEVDVSDNTEE